jgi:site-specific recombinase XerD
MATHLLETGVSRKEISDILGHKNYKSLQYYAKVSKTALRSVVMDKDLEDLI